MRSECKITFFLNSNDLEKVIEHLCMQKKILKEQQLTVRLFLIKPASVPNYKKGYFMSQSYRFYYKNVNRLLLIRLPQFYQTD